MNRERLAFSLFLLLWLALVAAPAAWAILTDGGYEELVRCLTPLLGGAGEAF